MALISEIKGLATYHFGDERHVLLFGFLGGSGYWLAIPPSSPFAVAVSQIPLLLHTLFLCDQLLGT